MNKNVIILTAPEDSQAYEIFSRLKTYHKEDRVDLKQMAVVKHTEEKPFDVKDFADLTGQDKFFAGSAVGAILGLMGGPLGMLLGWAGGGLLGGAVDTYEVADATSVFQKTASAIPVGSTALIIIANEYTEKVIDGLAEEFGASVTRMPENQVLEDVAAARETEKSLREEARRQWKKDRASDKD